MYSTMYASQKLHDHIASTYKAAVDKYNERFDNELYKAAIAGKTVAGANFVIDQALALCGDPHRQLIADATQYTQAELAFYELFID